MALNDDLRAGITQLATSTQIFQQESSKHEATRLKVLSDADKKMLAIQAQTDKATADLTITGNPKLKGFTRKCVFQGFLNGIVAGALYGQEGSMANALIGEGVTLSNAWLHLKLPHRIDTHHAMFDLRVYGFALTAWLAFDARFAGYCYKTSNTVSNKAVVGNLPDAAIYAGSDNHVYLRFKLVSVYYLNLNVDAMLVGNGFDIKAGDITAIFDIRDTL